MDETAICNQALDILKEAPISSLSDQRPIGRWCARNFDTTRDALLSMANWNFAMKRASLAAEVTAPAFGWEKAYTLPTDCLRLVALTYEGYEESNPVRHIVEGGAILTNAGGPLPIRYVARTVNYNTYHALFIEALAARLAFKCAHWATGKTGYQQVAQSIFDRAYGDAWLTDAIEGDQPMAADNAWIDARY